MLPKKYPVFTWWAVVTVTVKVIFLVLWLKAKTLGFTDTLVPNGGSITAL
jgi:hypothetical protein